MPAKAAGAEVSPRLLLAEGPGVSCVRKLAVFAARGGPVAEYGWCERRLTVAARRARG